MLKDDLERKREKIIASNIPSKKEIERKERRIKKDAIRVWDAIKALFLKDYCGEAYFSLYVGICTSSDTTISRKGKIYYRTADGIIKSAYRLTYGKVKYPNETMKLVREFAFYEKVYMEKESSYAKWFDYNDNKIYVHSYFLAYSRE